VSDASRQIRTRGTIVLVIGALLAVGMVMLVVNLAPTLLHPGVEVDGTRFTGTPEQGRMVLALLGWVGLLGVAFAGIGVHQMRTGRRDAWPLYIAGIMIAITLVGAWMVSSVLG
jgi:hypothetical protein